MNARRVAELLRELADELDEPASETPPVEDERPRRRVRSHPAPLHPPNDLDVERARKMLRRRGMST